MTLIACAALTLAALLYVFWFTPERVRVKTPAERERDFLLEKRGVVYDNLRDLHLEYRMGKLSDADYQNTKARYQEELAALLASLEKAGGSLPPPASAQAAASRPEPSLGPGICPRCRTKNAPTNRFCGACGQELTPTEFEA